MLSPVFIFSLPRSGSTLLQRVLMANENIASLSEPWFLLPFIYSNKRNGVLSEYSHSLSFNSVQDFINNLPNKNLDFYSHLNEFATKLYNNQCRQGEKYFLDKTPRYYLVIREIAQIFPNAKFIFLFRNPVHVFSSIIETWSKGRLNELFKFQVDLFDGPGYLSDGYSLLKQRSFAIKYEDFISDPEKHIKDICTYLEIDFSINMIKDFSEQDTKGRLGDRVGSAYYKSINLEPLTKWRETINTSFRKKLAKKLIQSIGVESLEIQGYSKTDILEEINNLKVSIKLFNPDILDYWYSKIVLRYKPNIFWGETTKKWSRDKYLS